MGIADSEGGGKTTSPGRVEGGFGRKCQSAECPLTVLSGTDGGGRMTGGSSRQTCGLVCQALSYAEFPDAIIQGSMCNHSVTTTGGGDRLPNF